MAWLVTDGRAEVNPMAHFSPLNAETDEARERRPCSADDFAKLIEATLTAPVYRCLSGEDRVMLYLVAVSTGLRASELKSLLPESFDLEAAAVAVKAAHSKRRENDRQPLRRDLVAILRAWLPGREGLLWPGSWSNHAAAMLRADLHAAGLSDVDAAGKVLDFHALRNTFISGLARAGVPAKVAQTLARHSSITLTLDTYAKIEENDGAAAVEKLPALPALLTQNLTQECVSEGHFLAQVVTFDTNCQFPDSLEPVNSKAISERYLSPPVVNCHGNNEEALVRVELTMADLQSAALATWLQRHVLCLHLSVRETLRTGQGARAGAGLPAAATWSVARNATMRTEAWFVSDFCPPWISSVCIFVDSMITGSSQTSKTPQSLRSLAR